MTDMKNAQKRFVRTAVISVLVLLVVLLGVINAISFTMAATDADRITEMIAERNGSFGGHEAVPGGFDPSSQTMGPMGPASPETRSSVRYFTARFTGGGGELVFYNISAVGEEEALSWAEDLMGAHAGTSSGWTHGTYRYRVYSTGRETYVTVIDQGRELIGAYRILIFSACGTLAGVLVSWLILRSVGEKLFSPLEEADRKQKTFIAGAEKEFRTPLTVIAADTEILERRHGPSEESSSIRRQLRKLGGLLERLGSLAIFEEKDMSVTLFSLSDVMNECLDRADKDLKASGISAERDIDADVTVNGDPQVLRQVITELVGNVMHYARGSAVFRLKKSGERIRLSVSNPADLPDGACSEAFDRFTVLKNGREGAAGLGLSYVKDAVAAHNGRVSAEVSSGVFTVRIDL